MFGGDRYTKMHTIRIYISKKVPLIIALLAMVTSCTTDIGDQESSMSVEYTDIPIGFGVSDISRGTAQNSTWDNGSTFAVTALHYSQGSSTPLSLINDNTVTYADATSSWTYAPVVYWPKSGTVDFFSYAPACEGARKEFSSLTTSHINHQAMLMDCHVPASQITTIHTLQTLGTATTPYPHDASNQYDMMFAFQRNVLCAEQSVTSKVTMHFAHVMSGITLNLENLKTAKDPGSADLKIPANTSKIVIGLGRIKTGGTLAICDASAPNDVIWTLDGLEGTFYETYDVTWEGANISGITREGIDGTFFFPPQKLESGLTITAYFYNSSGTRIGYRTLTENSITELERGKIITLNLK